MSLKKKAIDGVLWTFSQQFSVQIINLGVQIILARLLLPEAFGVIALLQVFMSIGQTLMDGGMTSSLIRTKNVDQKDYSTVFFINLFSSVFLYFLLYASAPAIADFFNQPSLVPVIRAYTLIFVIQALVAVQTTRLTKEMNFKLQMYMQIPSTIFGGIVGLSLAYYGFGVWSLVWMAIANRTLFMIQHWFMTGWKPDFIIDKERLKHHFGFGYKLTLSALLTSIYTNSYTFIIGKFFSATQLGFYNQANTLRMFPVANLTAALHKVTYPLFSSIQDDDLQLAYVFKKITKIVFFIVAPIMMFLVVIAEPLFRFVLTDKWLPAVPFFQILCVSAIVYPHSMYNLNIISAKGRSDLHLKLEVIKKSCSAVFLLLIIPFGIWGVVVAQAISMFIHAFVNALYSGKMINYPINNQLRDVLAIVVVGLISMLILEIFIHLIFQHHVSSDWVLILVSSLIYGTIYIGISYFGKLNALQQLHEIVKDFIKNK